MLMRLKYNLKYASLKAKSYIKAFRTDVNPSRSSAVFRSLPPGENTIALSLSNQPDHFQNILTFIRIFHSPLFSLKKS